MPIIRFLIAAAVCAENPFAELQRVYAPRADLLRRCWIVLSLFAAFNVALIALHLVRLRRTSAGYLRVDSDLESMYTNTAP